MVKETFGKFSILLIVFLMDSTCCVFGDSTPVKPGIIGTYRTPDFIDVYYESDPVLSTIDVNKNKEEISQPQGFVSTVEKGRNWFIIETANFRGRVDIIHPSLKELRVGNVHNILGPQGLWMEIEDEHGVIYSSKFAPNKSRHNTWRAGIYYYDAHLLDFQLASSDGKIAPVQGELTFHSFPDKINVQAIFTIIGDIKIKRAELICDVSGTGLSEKDVLVFSHGDAVLGIAGGTFRKNTVRVNSQPVTWKFDNDHIWDDKRIEVHMALFPGPKTNHELIKTAVLAELHPLTKDNFHITNASFDGYDAGRGLYIIHQIPLTGYRGFWSYDTLNFPKAYLTAEVEVKNNTIPRRIFLIHEAEIGPIQAGILTDLSGFPLPKPVQCSKSWKDDGGEPLDPGFSEIYYPIDLQPNEKQHFRSLHLCDFWGNHNLRQVSSIMFYQIYYHLSNGKYETTCFTLPTKFANIPSGEPRAYNVCDVRPVSSLCGQHVALQGWLQYLDNNNCWQWPRYKGSTVISNSPNLAWLIMNYESSDGKVDETIEIFEMPQTDESRTFMRMRLDFKKDITIGGDLRHNLRLYTSGSYIRMVHWKELAWTDEKGEIQKLPMKQDGTWTADGIPIRHVNSFVAAYPHVDGNNSIVIRSFKGMVNGKPFNNIGFSAIGHKNNQTEIMLVPLLDNPNISAGSWMELDFILVPYGDESSNEQVPWLESIRHGLNEREIKEFFTPEQIKEMGMEIWGPKVDVTHGKHLLDSPPTIQAEDNWASFTLSGGHDRTSLIVKGFKAHKLPMLWKDSTFINQQALGGDGYQVLKDSDGKYSFVFAPQTFTSRTTWGPNLLADGVAHWRTVQTRYYVTQAISEANIVSVKTPYFNEVELTIEGNGETVIDSPRLWCPATNRFSYNCPIKTATTQAGKVTTVPVSLDGDYSSAEVTINEFTSDSIKLAIFTDKDVTVIFTTSNPKTQYEVDISGKKLILEVSRDGYLSIPVIGGERIQVIAKKL